MKIFSLYASSYIGASIAAELGSVLSAHEEREFDDTEFKVRALDDVRGERIVVCQSLFADDRVSASDKLLRLLVFIGALKDAGASEVVAVVPYLAYARKDRRTKPGDPITTRYVASFFEAAGTDAIVTADVHDLAAFENAYRCRKANAEAVPLFVEHFAAALPAGERVVALSPDAGGMKRAMRFAQSLAERSGAPVGLALMEKQRSEGQVRGDVFGGDVAGATVIVVDDMISTGTTVLRAARAALERGASVVHVAATHAVFSAGAPDALSAPEIASVVVTDTVSPQRTDHPALREKLTVLGCAPLLAAAVKTV
ncbi:MAG TPA: ribose-phosphate diphosphokinase [Gammaproteobacteria bacterium]